MNVHELIKIKPMKVKDYKPLYKTIQIINYLPIFPFGRVVKLMDVEEVNKRFSEYTLLSVMNFHDTKITGYIIEELDLWQKKKRTYS